MSQEQIEELPEIVVTAKRHDDHGGGGGGWGWSGGGPGFGFWDTYGGGGGGGGGGPAGDGPGGVVDLVYEVPPGPSVTLVFDDGDGVYRAETYDWAAGTVWVDVADLNGNWFSSERPFTWADVQNPLIYPPSDLPLA